MHKGDRHPPFTQNDLSLKTVFRLHAMVPARRKTRPDRLAGSRSLEPLEGRRRAPTNLITRTPGLARRETPSPPLGSGLKTSFTFLLVLAIAGLAMALTRSGDQASALSRPSGDLAACPTVVNAWAQQRLGRHRQELEQEHDLNRADGEAPNAVTAAMRWMDERIIEHYIEKERNQIRAMTRASRRCLPVFSPESHP